MMEAYKFIKSKGVTLNKNPKTHVNPIQ